MRIKKTSATFDIASQCYVITIESNDFCPGSTLVVVHQAVRRERGKRRLILTLEEQAEVKVISSERTGRVPFTIVDKDVLDVTGGSNARS